MPKYLIQYSLFNCLSLILRQELRLCTFFCGGWNITKFDLSMLRDNLLAQSQVWTLLSSLFFVVFKKIYQSESKESDHRDSHSSMVFRIMSSRDKSSLAHHFATLWLATFWFKFDRENINICKRANLWNRGMEHLNETYSNVNNNEGVVTNCFIY